MARPVPGRPPIYVLEAFAETRPEVLHALIREFPLGSLVTHGAHGLDANHLPFELLPEAGPHCQLIAHVARANPLWQQAKDGDAVLVIFRCADAYVSPNWYPSKHETHRLVPTWNYRVVHVHGTLTIRDDERFVRGVVARLTRRHEAGTGAERPWRMSDSPEDFIRQMLGAIVGLEIAITRIEGKLKLGQNREERDRLGAADGLQGRGEMVISGAMRAG